MPRKEIINLGTAAPNPNLSPATRFGNLVFVAGQVPVVDGEVRHIGRVPDQVDLGPPPLRVDVCVSHLEAL